MKRRFTILTAALALLTFLAIPMGMMGQTRDTQTVSYGWETTDDVDPWTISEAIVATQGEGNTGTFAGRINTNSTTVQFNEKVYVTSFSYAFKRTSNNNNYSVYIETSTDGSTWSIKDTQAMNTFTNGSYRTVTKTFDGTQELYVRFRCNNTTAVRYVDDVTITYNTSAAQLDPCDLTLTNASSSIVFDLYNNSDAYVINYTTSSTGEVTVADSDYITTVVDQTNKTITVTPVAVTDGAKVITVNQAADDNYAAGSKTFTINITDSTPFTGGDVTFNATIDKGTSPLVKQGVTFSCTNGVLNNGSEYRLYKNSVTTFSVSEGTITQIAFTGVSGNPASGFATQTGWTTDGNNGTWIGNAQEVSFTASGAQVRATLIVVTVDMDGAPAPTITAEDVNIAYDAEEGTINYTINNPVDGGSITASCDAEWIEVDDTPQTDAEGSIDFICAPNSNFYAHSATVTLTYTYGDSKTTVTKDVTVTQALDPDANGSTIDYPIMVSEAIEAIDEVGSVSNIYVGGIVSEITASTSSYITFKMYDEDGDDYYLQAYHCTGNNFNEVAVGDQVVVYGTLEKYGTSVYQFASGCELVSLIHPAVPSITVNPDEVNVDAEEHDGTLALTYENLVVSSFEDFLIQFYDANGNELNSDNEPDWIEVNTAEDGDDLLVSYFMLENGGLARTAYFKVATLVDDDLVYSNLVTISQAAPVVPPTPSNWVLTDLADLTADDVFVIVGDNGDTYAMPVDGGGQNGAPAAVAVTVVEGTLSAEPAANLQWNISITEDGYTFYPNGETETWLYCTNANNGVRVGTGDAKHFTLDEGYLTTTETTDQRYIGIYNSQDWRCYKLGTDGTFPANIANQTFSFYKKVELPTITVTGYGNTDGGYVLLAWPESTSPADIEGMISDNFGTTVTPETSTYDLYSYDGSQEKEWRNYRKNNFNLVPGKGYLYASKEGVTLTYEGDANPEFDDVELSYVADNKIQSLYLAGNSKTTAETFYVYDANNKIAFNYLVMNEDGNGFTSGQADYFEAQPLQGFFVQAPKASTTLSTNDLSKAGGVSLLNVQVMRNRGTVVDNAIVSFSNGPTMKKFQLFENSTKLYIPQDNEDYAIVRSEGQGELPVSFRAAENGTYTLSMNVENIDMNYLHLIDNMTGMDIDLLQTPSYTFEANTNDYANRFKLVFAANGTDEADEASFAFFSDGNLIVNNEGNATLQVIDVNGRILSSETISGSCSKAINATTGVYMLRLINGDNVKVQKVVVR